MRRLVIASRNPGKLEEFRWLLRDVPVEVVPLSSFPDAPELEERGSTFSENALLKARVVARFTGELTLADDSGIEVDALGGRPGPLSSRYAGEGATDLENNLKLLKELFGLPLKARGATFVCVLALVSPEGKELLVEGRCRGRIGFEMRGTNGFGYDPLFICRNGKTLAELPPHIKNKISHRGRAFHKLLDLNMIT